MQILEQTSQTFQRQYQLLRGGSGASVSIQLLVLTEDSFSNQTAAIEGEAGTRQQLARRHGVSDPQPFIDSNTTECIQSTGTPEHLYYSASEGLESSEGQLRGHPDSVDPLRTRQRCGLARSR